MKPSWHDVQEVASEQKLQLVAQLGQFLPSGYFPAPQPPVVQVLVAESHLNVSAQTAQSLELLQELQLAAQARHLVPDTYFPEAQPQVLSVCDNIKSPAQAKQVLASEQVVQPTLQALHAMEVLSR